MKSTRDEKIRAIKKNGDTYSESHGRGRGSLFIERNGNTFSAYFRYWKGDQRNLVILGYYKPTPKSAGLTWSQLWDKSLERSRLKQDIHPKDLKEYLEEQEEQREREAEEARLQAEKEACQGTLQDLIVAYTSKLKRQEKVSAKNVATTLATNVSKAFPKLIAKKAADITTDDIMKILTRILERGCTTNYNRVRSYLQTAFNVGQKADYDPRLQLEHGKRFYLTYNPVEATPKYAEYERVRTRQLSDDEIRDVFASIERGAPTWSPLYGLLIRFLFSFYGNRPEQISNCKWADIDFIQQTLTFIDKKGKNGEPKERVITLTPRAMAILNQARKLSGDNPGPFWIGQKASINVSSLGNFVRSYNNWYEDQLKERADELGKPVEPYERWTTKDIRRTCTRILVDSRIHQEQRFLLQSREPGTIEDKHYIHDKRLPEKREAARDYDRYLGQILENSVPDKLVDFEQYREKYTGSVTALVD